MILVNFKALIPKAVKSWITEREYEDNLAEAQRRLYRKLSEANTNSYFALNGTVQDVELEEKSWVGNCTIKFNVQNEQEAKIEFKKLFGDMAKKGQKFRLVSFDKVSESSV